MANKLYYHATSLDNFQSIIDSGQVNPGCDGLIYLAETQQDALKFVALRCYESIVVIELNIPDESMIVETFDHSYAFFKCRAFGYPQSIGTEYIKSAMKYPSLVNKPTSK